MTFKKKDHDKILKDIQKKHQHESNLTRILNTFNKPGKNCKIARPFKKTKST